MTNTHSIKELKIIEETLSELVKASQSGTNISHMLELLSDRVNETLPTIALDLVIHDISKAESNGLLITDDQKVRLIDKSISIEEAIQPKIRAA